MRFKITKVKSLQGSPVLIALNFKVKLTTSDGNVLAEVKSLTWQWLSDLSLQALRRLPAEPSARTGGVDRGGEVDLGFVFCKICCVVDGLFEAVELLNGTTGVSHRG